MLIVKLSLHVVTVMRHSSIIARRMEWYLLLNRVSKTVLTTNLILHKNIVRL